MWKEAIVSNFGYSPRVCLKGTEENNEKTSVWMDGLEAEINFFF
jgi:hypothetical protein